MVKQANNDDKGLADYFAKVKKSYEAVSPEEKKAFLAGLERILGFTTQIDLTGLGTVVEDYLANRKFERFLKSIIGEYGAISGLGHVANEKRSY